MTFPTGVPQPEDQDVVSILVTEIVARRIEEVFFKPAGLKLAGPLRFSDDDVPAYIIEVPA